MKNVLFILVLTGLVTLHHTAADGQSQQDAGTKGEDAALVAQNSTTAIEATTNRAGMIIPDLGRDYLAYPDTSGIIRFNNCWLMGRVPLIEQWISEFNRFYPRIKVVNDNPKQCPELVQYQKTLIAGRVPPDVLMIQSQNFRVFTEIEAVRPLDDLIERDRIESAWFYPSEWNARRIDGKVYGLPNVTAGAQMLMFYKQQYLQEAGLKTVKTWQDLESLAKVARDNALFILDPGKMSSARITFFQALLYSNGGRVWNNDFTTVTWNSPEGLQAAQWLLKFVKLQADNYEALRAHGEHREIITADVFATGPYIAARNGPWFFYQLKNAAPNLAYVVAPFPRNAQQDKSMGYTPTEGGWSFSIATNISPENQAAAWEWIKFTTVSRYACEFTVAQMRPSPVRLCNEDKRLSTGNPHWGAVKKALEHSEAVVISAIHLKLQEILIKMQEAILFELMPPAKALKVYADKAQALLDEWNREHPRHD